MLFTRRGAIAALAVSVALLAGACTVPPADGGGTTATYKNGRCAGTEGVTVVVDYAAFRNEVVVRCALGNPTTGFAVLDAAKFNHDPGRYPGTVCQLDGLPTQGHPYCWTTGGYWSYWRSTSAGGPWIYSEWGAGAGPALTPGAVEGWRFAPFADGAAKPPRVGTAGPIVP